MPERRFPPLTLRIGRRTLKKCRWQNLASLKICWRRSNPNATQHDPSPTRPDRLDIRHRSGAGHRCCGAAVMTTQFPEHRPRVSDQPTLASGCHGLPAEVTIGCGGGTYFGPRMAGNGETYTPTPGRVAGPGDSSTLRRGHSIYASADSRPTFHEWAKDCRENLGSAHPFSFTQPGI